MMGARQLIAVGTVSVLTACGNAAPEPPVESAGVATTATEMTPAKSTATVATFGPSPTLPITRDCKGKPIGDEIVLTLDADKKMFKDLSDNRAFVRDVKLGGKSQDEPPEVGEGYWSTNLDASYEPPKGEVGYTKMTIRLKPDGKTEAIFLRPPTSNDPATKRDSSAAISVQKAMEPYFCGLTKIKLPDENDPYESLSFGITLPPQTAASYNIGVMVRKLAGKRAYWTPVFIDPNVKNEG